MKRYLALLFLLLVSSFSFASFPVSNASISPVVVTSDVAASANSEIAEIPRHAEQVQRFLKKVSDRSYGYPPQSGRRSNLSDLAWALVGGSTVFICVFAYAAMLGASDLIIWACLAAVPLLALAGMITGIVALSRGQRHKARAILAVIFGAMIALPFLIGGISLLFA